MGKLFDLVEAYRDRYAPHRPSLRKVALELDISPQTLTNFQQPTKLPKKEHLEALANLTGVPYQRVLDALLDDIGYLREDQQPAVMAARRTRSGKPSSGQQRRQAADAAGEDNQDPEGES